MINKKVVTLGFAAILIGAAVHSGPTLAQAGAQALQTEQRMAKIKGLVADLDLTQEQKDRIREIVASATPTIQPIVQKLQKNGSALRAATEQGSDETAVRDLADREGRLVTELTVQGAHVKTQIYAVLNAAQQKKVRADENGVEQFIAGRHFGDMLMQVLQ